MSKRTIFVFVVIEEVSFLIFIGESTIFNIEIMQKLRSRVYTKYWKRVLIFNLINFVVVGLLFIINIFLEDSDGKAK